MIYTKYLETSCRVRCFDRENPNGRYCGYSTYVMVTNHYIPLLNNLTEVTDVYTLYTDFECSGCYFLKCSVLKIDGAYRLSNANVWYRGGMPYITLSVNNALMPIPLCYSYERL